MKLTEDSIGKKHRTEAGDIAWILSGPHFDAPLRDCFFRGVVTEEDGHFLEMEWFSNGELVGFVPPSPPDRIVSEWLD